MSLYTVSDTAITTEQVFHHTRPTSPDRQQ
jgi:hypothetical protein